MALFPIHPGAVSPLSIDAVNTEIASILGGEVLTLTSVVRANSSTETSSADAKDGYLFDASGTLLNRPAVTRAATAAQFPLYLSDDGTSGYGTQFGSLVGSSFGLNITGSVIGPNTASASGKLSCWDKAGRYAVTTDALNATFVSSIPSTGLTPGAVLGISNSTDIGKLCHAACTNAVSATGVGNFVQFMPRPGLVNTPARLAGGIETFDRIEFEFTCGLGVRTL